MPFLQDIQDHILLFDGALPPLLGGEGEARPQECPALRNATRPMDVLDAHQAYLDAGADVICANTFGANPLRLAQFGLEERMEELVQSGMALCREAAGGQSRRKVYAAATLGPTGELYQRDVSIPTQMYKAFFAQSIAAEASGAELILIETMSDLCEARLAILAARAATNLPIICSFMLESDDCTFAGNPPEVLSLYCTKIGASLCGVNCGYGPEELFHGYSRLSGSCPLPTFARPNAGAMSPEAMAAAMAPYLHAGAAAIGGCCGATPAHIRALRKLLDTHHGHARTATLQEEYICAPGKRLALAAAEPYTLLSLSGLSEEDALDRIQELVLTEPVLHIDFADWSAEAIDKLVFYAIPHTRQTPLAFHLRSAKQANAALLAYPGIAAVYAQGDAYRVLKAAVRYGAEVIS